MEFKDRLKKYREDNKYDNKKNFAEWLGIQPSLYYVLESGTRTPSKDVLNRLVAKSGKPEEYWLFGVSDKEYIDIREDLKSIKKAIDTILELNLVKDVDKLFSDNYSEGTIEELLIAALKSDIEYMKKKRESK